MFRFKVYVLLLALFVSQHYAATIFLGGVIRDQAPNTMKDCGSAGDANGGNGFTGTDFQISGYQDDEYGLAGKECNSNYGWYPPACGAITSATDRTPKYAYTGQSSGKNVRSPASFYNWFHDSTQTRNIVYNIPLTLKTGTQYSYANDSFFPIDNLGWKDKCPDAKGKQHNYGFCLEAHTRFGFHGAESFQFSGDDDVWVYIDDRLVIDLGSLHPKRTKKITLSTIPGLTVGQNYRLDFFYCERHTTESNMELTTSIEFYCSYYDWCGVCEGTGRSCCTQDIIDNICNDRDACTTDTCDSRISPLVNATAGCIHTPIACASTNKCEIARCDKTAGCQISALNCDDNDDCTIDYCDARTGCGHRSCNGTGCPSKCIPRPPCYDGNLCTSDIVLGYFNGTANCSNELNTTVCDDQNVCTNDFCDSSANTTATACSFTNVTCIPNLCQTIAGCDRVNGCIFAEKKCPGADDFCQIASCDPLGGCIVATKVCVVNDPYCFKGVCNSAKAECRSERVSDWSTSVSSNGILCALRYDNAVKGAAIGTGAAVGIAVGGAVAAGLFGYGGKKGYDYIQLMRNQKFDGVQNNPLYEQTNQNSDNPLYRYSTTAPA